MTRLGRAVTRGWLALGPRFLPFADAASADLPLGRLLRLSLFQVSVGMAIVLMIGTLNRVMIVELKVPASLVGGMIALPLLVAPLRARIGFLSDTHRSALGWRRVPFMYRGAMLQFGGLSIMPFALLVLSGQGDATRAPAWLGMAAGGLAFLLVGAGLHTTQTVGLALATDLARPEKRPQVVGLMYVMLLFGMMASALGFGFALSPYSDAALIRVVQTAAVLTLALNGIALWQQEARRGAGAGQLDGSTRPQAGFAEAWARFTETGPAVRRLCVVGLGTLGLGMADVLLEPYGGQILHLSVADTTKLTAALALGGLTGFALASRVLARGADPLRMAALGIGAGVAGFLMVLLAVAPLAALIFGAGTWLIGFGAGLFGHGTLTATMNAAPREQAGLALGAWGAVQATAAGLAIAVGGIIRDAVLLISDAVTHAGAYRIVYGVEIILLMATLVILAPLTFGAGRVLLANHDPSNRAANRRAEIPGRP